MELKGKSAFEASSILQGPSGASVTIQVRHGNCGPVELTEVQRQLVARTPVFYRLEQMDGGATPVGYIRLKEFNALARKDLVIAMKRLQDMGASSYILDLRDNLGGLVQVASALHDNCKAVLVGKGTFGKLMNPKPRTHLLSCAKSGIKNS
ncbi:hypothetical protein PIB30_045317 [Stylosanthes scabra]|uniref:Tail specific protease domain-containing protein n=1 Tax=Stylosanthes scabra TaxID=79078 RepID=A0ABU6WE49_9FABA|nr:hypothetical protein [Stylosanthes scabra]